MKKLVPCVFVLLILVACRPDPLERAKEHIDIGMSREDAVKILNGEAWYHQPCETKFGINDLFFYGDHRYNRAEIVIMSSAKRGNAYEVVKLSSFEPYLWQKEFADCIQRDRFED